LSAPQKFVIRHESKTRIGIDRRRADRQFCVRHCGPNGIDRRPALFPHRRRAHCSVREKKRTGVCRPIPHRRQETVLSLRLIEFLDFLQDRLAPEGRITITSGYRSPQYNQNLRRTGGLAAKASLHQYGMAADLILEGVPARHLWEYVKALGFGGTGYYHGQTVHIDVGPARSWDEATSGVGTGISDDNKLIGLVTDYDVYRPGEPVRMRFIRMTAFPIDVAVEFALARRDAANEVVEVLRFTPVVDAPGSGDCRRFADIDQMTAIRWRLPANLPAGRYHIRAGFCENPYEAMPAEIGSPEFVVNRNFGS